MKLNKKYLIVAMLSLFASETYAAGLERSSQSIDVLFESGTYAEIGYTHVAPKVTGTDISGHPISDMAADTQSLNYAVKTDLTPSLRLAVIYDEPYGAKVRFEGENNFTEANAKTRATVKAKNVTTLLGYNINKNILIYAGPALQELEVDTHLRGATYRLNNGYNNQFSDMAVGWVTGLSYMKPEKGILASLTYRSEIEHKMNIHEDVPLADALDIDYSHENKGSVITPESINLGLQTGLNMTTVLYGRARYVPWSDFEYRPPVINAASAVALNKSKGLPLVDYAEDQISAEIGLGKKILPNLAISVSGGWDSGTGNPASTLGPVDGYWGAGLAAKYNINQNFAFSLGGRFLWFGDAKGELSDRRIVGDFKDNTGYAVGMKFSYKSK